MPAKTRGKKTPVKPVEPTTPDVSEEEPVEVNEPAATEVSTSEPDENSTPHLTQAEIACNRYQSSYDEIKQLLSEAFKAIQVANRMFKKLESQHNRTIATVVKKPKRKVNSVRRTPNVLMNKDIISFFKSRLEPEDWIITRKSNGEESQVNLSKINTKTPVYRTDVTQLFHKVFRKHNLLNEEDRREIVYGRDKGLVKLLTSGTPEPKYQHIIDGIKDGTIRMTIFNIQCVTNQLLSSANQQSGDGVETVASA